MRTAACLLPMLLALVLVLGCTDAGTDPGGSAPEGDGSTGVQPLPAQGRPQAGTEGGEEPLIRVVVTVRPLELLLKEFVPPPERELVEIICIVPPEADPANYQLTEANLRAIQNADILVANGHHVDLWAIENSPTTVKVILAQQLWSTLRRDPTVGIDGQFEHYWLDPPVMRAMGSAFVQEIVRRMKGHVDNARVASVKDFSREFWSVMQDIDRAFLEALIPFSEQPLVCAHGTLDLLAARYMASRVVPLQSAEEDDPSTGMIGMAEALVLMQEEEIRVVFVETPFDRSIAEPVAAQAGARIVSIDVMGGDNDGWFDLMAEVRRELVRGLKGEVTTADAGG